MDSEKQVFLFRTLLFGFSDRVIITWPGISKSIIF